MLKKEDKQILRVLQNHKSYGPIKARWIKGKITDNPSFGRKVELDAHDVGRRLKLLKRDGLVELVKKSTRGRWVITLKGEDELIHEKQFSREHLRTDMRGK